MWLKKIIGLTDMKVISFIGTVVWLWIPNPFDYTGKLAITILITTAVICIGIWNKHIRIKNER